MSYYGLYIPVKTGNEQSDLTTVFKEKHEALKVLKQHKDARLREFHNTEDAATYAQTGYEVCQSKYSDVKTSTASVEKLAFRAPSKQDLTELKKLIESGKYDEVKARIWENPRFLVSSGDTPTTLKEGYRYNALHICAISNAYLIADLILQTVSNHAFVELLSGKQNGKCSKELCAILLDYYLNMPEKGRCETPLHLAVKLGSIRVVEVLTSYPECKMTPNSDGLLPKDIVCSRNANASPELIEKIQNLLKERFFVPVFRSFDKAVPPAVGDPFSTINPPMLKCDPLSPEIKIQALAGPMNKEQAENFCRRWKTPPRLGSKVTSPISHNPFISPAKTRGGVGTPRSTLNKTARSPGTNGFLNRKALFTTIPPQSSPLDLSKLHMRHNGTDDSHNGNNHLDYSETLETINETNNNNNDIHNSTPEFLGIKPNLFPKCKELFFTYREQVDSPNVTDINILATQNSSLCGEPDYFDSPGYLERHLKITDTEKGLETIGRQLAKEQNIDWKEYWDFLGELIDISSEEGLLKLEEFLSARADEEDLTKKKSISKNEKVTIIDNICNALDKLDLWKTSTDGGSNNVNGCKNGSNYCRGGFKGDRYHSNNGMSDASNYNTNAPQSTTPYTCVEKSLQVFAKRMTKTILHNIENIVSINDTFVSELKRLKSLICSFKEDNRFLNVNFAKVHSRFANLIVNYLENSQDVDDIAKSKIQRNLQHILISPGERKEQLHCVCKLILTFMENDADRILPENLKTETMCTKAWLIESNCECQWENGLSRKSSRRARMEARYEARHDANTCNDGAKSSDTANVLSISNTNAVFSNKDDEIDEDVFWSDFCSDSDEEDNFKTPYESPSMMTPYDSDTESNNIFIYGTEPTKRDLDVLNAIFHVEIKKDRYPHIYAWKHAVLRYSNEEMDFFQSPSTVLKRTSPTKSCLLLSKVTENRLPVVKRLFSPSPLHNKSRDNIFYRDRLSSNSSLSSPSYPTRSDGSDGSSNLSLMNVSVSE